MEQQNQNILNEVKTEPVIVKQNNFLTILLSVLLLLSVSIAGFFAYQTQVLVKELNSMKETSTHVSSEESTIEPTSDWKTYMNENAGFLLKIPSNIEEVPSTDGLVSGPFESNPQLVVSFADKSTIVKNTDSPFDGFTTYMQEVAQLKMTPFSFEKYLNEELKNVKQSPRGIQSSEIIKKTIEGNEFSYIDYETNIRKYFILSEDGEKIAIFSRVNSSQDFLNDFDQILSTFKFIGSNSNMPKSISTLFDLINTKFNLNLVPVEESQFYSPSGMVNKKSWKIDFVESSIDGKDLNNFLWNNLTPNDQESGGIGGGGINAYENDSIKCFHSYMLQGSYVHNYLSCSEK